MGPWIAIWLAGLMEALVAGSMLLSRNPRLVVTVEAWLSRTATWIAQEGTYLYAVAQARFGPMAMSTVTAADFADEVIQNSTAEMQALLVRYGMAPEAVSRAMARLSQMVTEAILQVATTPGVIERPLSPPALPPWLM